MIKSFKRYLTELQGVKKYYGKRLDELFTEMGWEPIGNGKFSTVYEVPGAEYVVKVWTDDEPYEAFLAYIKQHPSKHFPKVFGRMKSIPAFYPRKNRKEMVKLVKLERLEPVSMEVYNMVERILNGATTYRRHFPVERKYKRKDGTEGVTTHTGWEDVPFQDVFPQFQTLRDDYFRMSDAIGDFTPDVKYGNVMQRKDGTVVLIDPFWFYNFEYEMYAAERREWDWDDHYEDDDVFTRYKKPHYLEKEPEKPVRPASPVYSSDEEVPF